MKYKKTGPFKKREIFLYIIMPKDSVKSLKYLPLTTYEVCYDKHYIIHTSYTCIIGTKDTYCDMIWNFETKIIIKQSPIFFNFRSRFDYMPLISFKHCFICCPYFANKTANIYLIKNDLLLIYTHILTFIFGNKYIMAVSEILARFTMNTNSSYSHKMHINRNFFSQSITIKNDD